MKLIEIEEDKLVFYDGTTIEAFHSQDCCEHVYADFKQLEDTDVFDHDFKDLSIEGVKDSGFRLEGYFIPCYNEQNGYYSDDLKLVIKQNGKDTDVDITDFVEDRID
jgi:hypothetical protein